MQPTRCEPRAPLNAAVRIFGLDRAGRPVSVTATTIDVSRRGARVSGVQCWDKPGEIIGVRYGDQKGRYKVVWVGKAGSPTQSQIGLLSVESAKLVWGVAYQTAAASVVPSRPPVAPRVTPVFASPLPPSAPNRRHTPRYLVEGGAQVREQGAAAGQWATLHDISIGGCYVETTSPLPLDALVEATITCADVQFRAHGVVTKSDRLVGMGIKFTQITPADRERLENLIRTLAPTAKQA